MGTRAVPFFLRRMEASLHSTATGAPALPLSEFQFELPPELIAQEPAPGRAAARLLVWNRRGNELTHTVVSDLLRFLRPKDLLVFNDTRVMPARLYGRTESGGAVELLVIRPGVRESDAGREQVWQCLGRPAKRLRQGVVIHLQDGSRAAVGARDGGRYDVAFAGDVPTLLQAHGELPLPPYIKRPDGPLPFDRERYQTVFADRLGAIAAPTAGLHFTRELLDSLRASGIATAFLTLHVGPGTFLPVRADDLNAHQMEAEWTEIPEATVELIEHTRRDGGRVIAVGTTTTRALESAATPEGAINAGGSWADCFIRPGYRFRVIDALFTNFHLPGSTLLALVSAFASRDATLAVYREAVARRYRFYSYGDAMFIQ